MSQKHSPSQFNNSVQLVLTGYNFRKDRGTFGTLRRILDLRDAPMQGLVPIKAAGLRAEILGRLRLIQQRLEGNGQALLEGGRLKSSIAGLEEDGLPYGESLAGPLDFGTCPSVVLSDGDGEISQLPEHLAPTPNLDSKSWLALGYWSRLFRFPDQIIDSIIVSLRAINMKAELAKSNNSIESLMHIALIGVRHRNSELAISVVRKCCEAIDDTIPATIVKPLVMVAVAASAGIDDVDNSSLQLNESIADAAWGLRSYEHGLELFVALNQFRAVSAPEKWNMSRAHAAATLAKAL